eukprot:11677824-Karenia_brevis.AAC.1
MLAHMSVGDIQWQCDSKGAMITPLMWRANRLVDFVAESAACDGRLPQWLTRHIDEVAQVVQHSAARLGHVTYLANHHVVSVTSEVNGSWSEHVVRDAAAIRPQRRRSQPTDGREGQPPETSCIMTSRERYPLALGTLAGSGRSRSSLPRSRAADGPGQRNRAASARHAKAQQRCEQQCLQDWLRSRSLTSPGGPTASERMAQLRHRVLARTTGQVVG